MHSKILILDFGSQVTQLIARRVRDSGVFSEVFPHDVSDECKHLGDGIGNQGGFLNEWHVRICKMEIEF